MEEKNSNNFYELLKRLNEKKIPSFNELPDVNLYMDQMIDYIKEILNEYELTSENEITSFMINNYVKAKLIKSPIKKKYNKDQLAHIIAIVFLKKVTSISNISIILNSEESNKNKTETKYNYFSKLYDENFNDVLTYVTTTYEVIYKKAISKSKKKNNEEIKSIYKTGLIFLALRLFIKSEINNYFAEKIMFELAKEDDLTKLFDKSKKEIKANKKIIKKETMKVKLANYKKELENKDKKQSKK